MFPWWLAFRYAFKRQSGGAANFLVRMAIMSLTSGVMLLVLVVAVMSGFERELKEKILNLAPHISIGRSLPISAKSKQDLIALYAPYTTGEQAFIESIDAVVELKALVVKGQKTKAIGIIGIEAEGHLAKAMQPYLLAGTGPLGSHDISLSRTMADKLGLHTGDNVLLMLADDGLVRRRPTIKSVTLHTIFETQTELDQQLAIMSLEGAQALGKLGDMVSVLHVHTNDVMQSQQFARRLYELNKGAYWVRDWTHTHGNLYQAIQTSRQMILLMLLVIIAVAAMNIVTAMTLVVSNKSKEIAMLMTMGLRPIVAMQVILIQGVFIAITGIGLGLIGGILSAYYITDIVRFIETAIGYQFLKSDIYPITYLPAVIELNDVLMLCIPAFIITILTALYPAWRATKVLPAEALRYDK